jgi:hypothetical protein
MVEVCGLVMIPIAETDGECQLVCDLSSIGRVLPSGSLNMISMPALLRT